MDEAPDLAFDTARSYIDDAGCVLFFAHAGERTLRCYVTRHALLSYFADAGRGDDRAACLDAFDGHRDAIQRIARRIIRRGAPAGGAAVVVSAQQVYRDIVARRRPAAAREER